MALALAAGPARAAGEELAEIVVTAARQSAVIWQGNRQLDETRDLSLMPRLGSTAFALGSDALQALPQGANTPLDQVLLQVPGVSADSALSNPDFHVRNEYANVQYRINGIQLPDGVSALANVLETTFADRVELLDGVLPAQYGLRTAGVVNIATRSRPDAGGQVDLYGGSWGTFSPSADYGDVVGDTEYFVTGRALRSDQGLENATPLANPLHDRTSQQKVFAYAATLFGDSTRLTTMAGGFIGRFEIPDVAAAASLNEHETDRFVFAVAALQTHRDTTDSQLALFTRYATVEFVPDIPGDLAFNEVAAYVARRSLLNGLQFDAADRVSDAHTLRAGWTAGIERTQVQDLSTLLPLDLAGDPVAAPVTVNDQTAKTGWTAGAYAQDEWRLRPDLTLNAGLRFDRMSQFTAASQVSPRGALTWRPAGDTTLHAGVSRYFTPPMQAQATPPRLALYQDTVQRAAIPLADPARAERATYFDVGLDQQLSTGLTAGLDVYYKRSTDTLDDGQFGQAVVLSEYNYADGFSRGAELKLGYSAAGFRAYANLSHEITLVKRVVSNQYLIDDVTEFAYLASHYAYASDAQTVTASAGASWRWPHLLASIDGRYGSGLRAGFANEQQTPGYTVWNAAVAASVYPWRDQRALSFRLSAVNLFDRRYVLREATGIGEFAPQYGPRRGIFAELTQQF